MRLELSYNIHIDIDIKRKKIKNFILRIYPDRSVKLSVPNSAKNDDVKRFLEEKRFWILKNINNINLRNSSKIVNSDEIWFLGEQKKIEIKPSENNFVILKEDSLIIQYNNMRAIAVLESWWTKNAKKFFEYKVDNYIKIFNNYDLKRPTVYIRKMKSLWGSCTPKKGTIRFNYYLLTVPEKCIDYVVLHELTHLIHPNHGNAFKAFLSTHMPDWKERKALLNSAPYIEDTRIFENNLNSF